MNSTQTLPSVDESLTPEPYGLIDFLTVLAKYKKLIIALPIFVGVVATVVTLVMPPVYRATATLLPPQQGKSAAAALLSQLGGAAGMVASATGLKNPNDIYVGMLKSRTVADNLVNRFSLLSVYETNSQEKSRARLQDQTSIDAAKSGLISVTVEDHDKQRAANLTNAYVDELVKLTQVLALTEASQRRLFFERQLELSKDNLASAELQLKKALGTHGVISVDSDSRSIVATVARIRAQLSAKEIQLSSMKAFVTPDNNSYRRVQEEISGLRAELDRLENGRPEASDTHRRTPQGLENIKTLRDVKYHQMLYELLAKQYEMARLDEASNSSVIQVLDRAVVPEQKFKPKRTIIVLISSGSAFLLALFLAFGIEAFGRWRGGRVGDAKWEILRTHLYMRK